MVKSHLANRVGEGIRLGQVKMANSRYIDFIDLRCKNMKLGEILSGHITKGARKRYERCLKYDKKCVPIPTCEKYTKTGKKCIYKL